MSDTKKKDVAVDYVVPSSGEIPYMSVDSNNQDDFIKRMKAFGKAFSDAATKKEE